jgi:hypothetical protein
MFRVLFHNLHLFDCGNNPVKAALSRKKKNPEAYSRIPGPPLISASQGLGLPQPCRVRPWSLPAALA